MTDALDSQIAQIQFSRISLRVIKEYFMAYKPMLISEHKKIRDYASVRFEKHLTELVNLPWYDKDSIDMMIAVVSFMKGIPHSFTEGVIDGLSEYCERASKYTDTPSEDSSIFPNDKGATDLSLASLVQLIESIRETGVSHLECRQPDDVYPSTEKSSPILDVNCHRKLNSIAIQF